MSSRGRKARGSSNAGDSTSHRPSAGGTASVHSSWGRKLALAATVAVAVIAVLLIELPNNPPARDAATSGDGRTAPESSRADAAYSEPGACSPCHPDIAQTYSATGMGRSFYRPKPGNTIEDYARGNPYFHQASERFYEMIQRGGRYYQRRYQIGPNGEQTNLLEKEVHYVMGSGNHARTYLHYTEAGKLVQLPLGWYSERDGYWAMNPGYDRLNHPGFQRAISYDCMFCHNGYPLTPPGQDIVGRRPLFREPFPEGIDCQRCHGPGRAHVEAAGSANPTLETIRETIVNPARLSPTRQLDVCFQCHLETTSRALPNVVHRYEHGYFSFRPGEALGDYALYFDHAPGSGWDEKFEINHAGYRLRKSVCFVKSEGALLCTTCHDPHRTFRGAEAAERYRAACRRCHGGAVDKLIAEGRHTEAADCVDCHMPKRRTDDVVHAVMTDHFIQRRKPSVDLLAERKEESGLEKTRYRGEVNPYYPGEISGADQQLYGAVAQVMQGSNLESGITRLAAAIEKYAPEQVGFYFELAAAYEEVGRLAESAEMFKQALGKKPDLALAQRRLGEVLSRMGEAEHAEAVLQKAIELDPGDAEAFKELGLHYARLGRFRDAVEASRAGIAIDPTLPALHNNLGGALMEMGSINEAEKAYREAIRLQPDLAEAQFNLANILAMEGNFSSGEYHWRQAIRSDPSQPLVRYNYAVALAGKERFREAETELRSAIAADPKFARAYTLLGNMLELKGRATEAIAQHRNAVEADPGSAKAHWNLAAALLNQGQNSAARASLKRAVALQPSHYEAHLALGRVFAAEGRLTEARMHLNEALKSSDPEVWRAATETVAKLPR